MDEIKFKCTIINERYYSDESSFGVYVLHTRDDIPYYEVPERTPFKDDDLDGVRMATLTGRVQQLYVGAEYEITATAEFNKRYNEYQYKPIIATSLIPKTVDQQQKFLTSIITRTQAESLLKVYPNIVEQIVNGTDNVDFRKTKGIKDKTYAKIKDKVLNNYVMSDLLVTLQPYGVAFHSIQRLMKYEPNPALLKQKLLDNPYILTQLPGYGFATVDSLALKIKSSLRQSEYRTEAFIKYYLNWCAENDGHTRVPFDALENAVNDNIMECNEIFKDLIGREIHKEHMLHFTKNGKYVGLYNLYKLETDVIWEIERLKDTTPLKLTQDNINNGIKRAEEKQGFTLTDEQKQCVLDSLKTNVSIITGPAGSGKTSISRAVLEIYKDADYQINCCAFSAKAAQRIIEATGFEAKTIHRLLGAKGDAAFTYNKVSKLESDVVLIDECSMMNANIYYNIVCAIKSGAKLIMCGDPAQLPPIGCGNIFKDLIDREIAQTSRLTKVLRQAEKSGILTDANKVRVGKMPIEQPEVRIISGENKDMIYMFRDDRTQLRDIAIKNYMKAVETDGIDEVEIIVPRREKCINSAFEINSIINDMITDVRDTTIEYAKRKYRVNTKVIQIENNYEKNVFNGEIGYITGINKDIDGETEIVVRFQMDLDIKYISYKIKELKQLDMAYALTTHKCQGSGYKSVISIIDMNHYTLLDSCMLYTMITRAKKRHMLLAEPRAFKMCIDNNHAKHRMTWAEIYDPDPWE